MSHAVASGQATRCTELSLLLGGVRLSGDGSRVRAHWLGCQNPASLCGPLRMGEGRCSTQGSPDTWAAVGLWV